MSQQTLSASSQETGHPRRWLILVIMCITLILVVVSVVALNVALPSIINDLEPSSTQTLWIVDAYALVFAGLLLPAGAIGDRFGRKGALLTGLGIFGALSIAATFATDPTTLIAARAAMGVGAALVMPATLSIITTVFPSHERAKAIAIWSGISGAGAAIGILNAGLLLKWYEWTSIFWVNVPIALIVFWLIVFIVPTSRDADQHPLDPGGTLLSVSGLTLLLIAIIEGPVAGWTSLLVLGSFAGAIVLLSGFVLFELRARFPMLDPRLFLIPRFGLSSLTITVNFMALFGMFFLISQYFQFVQGASPLESGMRTIPFPVTMILLSPHSPKLARRVGLGRAIALGLTIQTAGFLVLASLEPDSGYPIVVVGFMLLAIGMSALMAPATTTIVTSLPLNKAGVGSAVNDTTREVGGAIGIAVMGTLLTTGYQASVGDATQALPSEAADIAQDSIGGALIVAQRLASSNPAAAESLASTARNAFGDGMSLSFLFAAAASILAAGIIARFFPKDGANDHL